MLYYLLCLCVQSEKRVYELELANRERNYNKLFNVNPNVGVLDPLQFKRKAMADDSLLSGSSRHSSAPSLITSLSLSADTPLTHSSVTASSLAKQQQPKLHHASSHVNSKPQHLPGLIPSPTLSPASGHRPKPRAVFLNKDHLTSELGSKSLSVRQGHSSLSRILPQGTVVE